MAESYKTEQIRNIAVVGHAGSGKTTLGGKMIVGLLKSGHKVGVASNSHRAINELLLATERSALEEGFRFSGQKKSTADRPDSRFQNPDKELDGGVFISNVDSVRNIDVESNQLISGTAWLFCNPKFDQELDYLFVDEDLDGNPDVIATLRTEDWPLPMGFRFGLSFQPLGPESIIKNSLLNLTLNTDYYDSRDLNPYFVGGAELKVGNLLYLRSGIRREYQHYSDSIDDLTTNEIDDSANSELYVNRWSWGFGLTSESFPAIPYKLNLDYSVSDLGVLGISSQIGLTFKL